MAKRTIELTPTKDSARSDDRRLAAAVDEPS
jgi:hypothetical protein